MKIHLGPAHLEPQVVDWCRRADVNDLRLARRGLEVIAARAPANSVVNVDTHLLTLFVRESRPEGDQQCGIDSTIGPSRFT